jgi:hypothetical protein
VPGTRFGGSGARFAQLEVIRPTIIAILSGEIVDIGDTVDSGEPIENPFGPKVF